MPYLFLRPGNFRTGEWAEIDFQAREWRIQPGKMKLPAPHITPLAPQVVDMLEELHQLTGKRSRYLFPSLRTADRPMSENTLNAAFRRMGYSRDDVTGHGFRHMASTLLHEQGFASDAIGRQLGHMDRNEVRATCNYAQYLDERRIMMQAWGDFLDELRVEAGQN
ncbi:MAG TPA: site-specific integrase [Gammaproteobacteria bacterium]|nr:site-specific integrase [Gammaproteobacteria bacterium]